MGIVNSAQQLLDPRTATNFKRLLPLIDSRRPFHPKEKWRQATAMIEMYMADPNGIQVDPVEIFLGHPVRRVGAAIQQDRSGSCL
jgi:hypothetical protein